MSQADPESHASMDVLPGELQDIIASKLDISELMNLRLVSKKLSTAATRKLFSQILVTGWESSQDKFSSILASPEISNLVAKVGLDTDQVAVGEGYVVEWNPDPDERVKARGNERKTRLKGFKDIIGSLGSFPNVRDVAISFDYEVGVDLNEDWYRYDDPKEDVKFRTAILLTLFASLQDVKDLRSLSFKTSRTSTIKPSSHHQNSSPH
jgi:hypothetical protein